MPRCCCFFSLASNPSKEKVLSVIDQSTLEPNGRRIKNLRLAWPPPRHLIAFALLSVLTLVIVHLSPQSNRETSQLLSLALAILIPGYLLTLALFPSRMDLTMQRRALLSIGFAALLAILFGLILNLTPRGLQPASLATVLSLLALFLAAVSYVRWSELPRRNRFCLKSKSGLRSGRTSLARTPKFGLKGRGISLLLGFLVIGFIAALAFTLNIDQISSSDQGFTEFQVPWPKGLDGVGEASSQDKSDIAVNAKITNHESTHQSAITNSSKTDDSEKKQLVIMEQESKITVPSKSSAVVTSASNPNTQSSQTPASAPEVADTQMQETASTAAENAAIPESGPQEVDQVVSTESPVSETSTSPSSLASFASDAIVDSANLMENISSATNPSKENMANAPKLAISNLPPSKANLYANKSNPQTNDATILWTANASDPENDQILYRFLLNNSPATGWSEFNIWNWDTTKTPPGDYRITMLARDGKHASPDSFDTSTNATFTLIAPNQIPVPQELKPDKANPQIQGTEVTWTAQAIDPEGDKISYKFLQNDKEVTDWSLSNLWTMNKYTTSPGDYMIKVLVRDGKHASMDSFDGLLNATFTLLASNETPFLKSLEPDKSSPQDPGVTVLWKAEASDPNGDEIQYKFLLNGRTMSKWSKSNSWNWYTNGLPAGEYQIQVQAKEFNKSSEDSFDSLMNATFILGSQNQIPVLQGLGSDKSSPQVLGTSVTWTAQATDPDGDKIFYKFLLNDREVTGWSESDIWIWNTSSAVPGDYTIKVLVRDGKHSSEDSFDSSTDKSFDLITDNQKPVLQELKPDKTSPQAIGSNVTWTADATYTDPDKVSYRFMLNNREVSGWSRSNFWIWNTSSAVPGDYEIMVLARDDNRASLDSVDDFKKATFTLLASNEPPVTNEPTSNQPPILGSLEPDSSSPQVQGVAVIWKAKASDPDGDKIQYKFLLNGRAASRWSESDSWKWTTDNELPAGTYRVSVLARDGKHASEDSFDTSLDRTFTITTEIDLQIDQLMKQRKTEASGGQNYLSNDIQVSMDNATKPTMVLGKTKGAPEQGAINTPRKLGG